VRALEKPNIAAWAVNQLYWQRRRVYDRLIHEAEARRRAHAKLLKGKGGDVSDAEQAFSAALRAAVNDIRALLTDNGHEPSSATMNAVTDTLQALPGSTPPGRLTEPLKLVGFEALAGLVSSSALRGLTPSPPPPPSTARRGPPETPAATAAAARREAQDRKREDAARRRDQAQTIKALRAAKLDARRAEGELQSAQRDLARAREARDRLQDQLQFAVKKIDDAAGVVRAGEEELAQARREATRLEARLAMLRQESN